MNVIFHTLSSVALVAAVTDTNKVKVVGIRSDFHYVIMVLVLGVIAHGCLDYIPHAYPVNSKADAVASLLLITGLLYFSMKNYRLLVGAAILGCVLPDLIDLSSGIGNHYLNLHLPVFSKIFPWHWKMYSGSIYSGNLAVSNLNHILLLAVIAIICFYRRTDVKAIFRINS